MAASPVPMVATPMPSVLFEPPQELVALPHPALVNKYRALHEHETAREYSGRSLSVICGLAVNTKHELSETDKQLKTHKAQLEGLQNELISSRNREQQLVHMQRLAEEQMRAIRELQVLNSTDY